MTVKELAEKIEGTILVEGDFAGNIDSVYAGDFLSRVMGNAPQGCAWITVMTNVNVAGVAVLADVYAIIICENASPDKMLIEKCESEGKALITTRLAMYECCVTMSK